MGESRIWEQGLPRIETQYCAACMGGGESLMNIDDEREWKHECVFCKGTGEFNELAVSAVSSLMGGKVKPYESML